MGVLEKEHDQKPHPYTVSSTTNTGYRPTSLQFSINELPPTIEDTEHRYRPYSPSEGSITEDGMIEEYTLDYKDDKHGGFRNRGWRPSVREWLILICVSAMVMMDAYNATVIVPMVPVSKPPTFLLSDCMTNACLIKNAILAFITRLWEAA